MSAVLSKRTRAVANRASIYVGSTLGIGLLVCVGASILSVPDRAARIPTPSAPALEAPRPQLAPPPLDVPVRLIPQPPSGQMLAALATPMPSPVASPPPQTTTVADLGIDVIDQGQGVFVVRVIPSSPSERAGLAPGDLLVKLNSAKVLDTRRLLGLVASAPGESIAIRVARGGRIVDLSVDRGVGSASIAGHAYQIPELGMEVAETVTNRVVVHRVYKGSYAEKAGLASGDAVLAFNGKAVRGVKGLVALVAAAPPEKATPIRIARSARVLRKSVMIGEGEMETVTVPNDPASTYAKAMAAIDPTTPEPAAPAGTGPYQIPELGMEVVSLDADGVAVFRVYKGSFAEQAGLARGDFIFGFNGKSVRNLTRFVTLVTAAPPEQTIDIRIGRDGRVLNKMVTIGEGEMETATVPTDAAGLYTP
jgi:S1-C subfamily serine protease